MSFHRGSRHSPVQRHRSSHYRIDKDDSEWHSSSANRSVRSPVFDKTLDSFESPNKVGSTNNRSVDDEFEDGQADDDDDDQEDCNRHSHAQPKRALIRINPKLQLKPVQSQREFESDPRKTLFIGRLNPDTTEDTLRKHFDRFGEIGSLCLIRDIITGFSRRYAFCEYRRSKDADYAYAEANDLVIDGRRILVDRELGRTMKNWKPRRLGGGFSAGGHIRMTKPSGDSFQRASSNNHNSGYHSRGVSNFQHHTPHNTYKSNDRNHNHMKQLSHEGSRGRVGFDGSIRARMHGTNSGGYGNDFRRSFDGGRRE